MVRECPLPARKRTWDNSKYAPTRKGSGGSSPPNSGLNLEVRCSPMTRVLVPPVLGIVFITSVVLGSAHAQSPHPSTQDRAVLVTPQRITQWESELSNWGRWGPDDQRGTLNLITPEKRAAAVRLARHNFRPRLDQTSARSRSRLQVRRSAVRRFRRHQQSVSPLVPVVSRQH